ncbi:MAG: capsule assembly Wzi family protein [Phycisphaerales bacterium]
MPERRRTFPRPRRTTPWSIRSSAALVVLLGYAALFPQTLQAQRLPVGDGDEAYLRVLQLLGRAPDSSSLLIRPLALRSPGTAAADTARDPWSRRWGVTRTAMGGRLHVHDPEILGIFHSGFPDSRNEGALTPGRYLTTALRGGVSLREGPLTVSWRPMAAWVQNGDFPLAPVQVDGQPEFAYPWRRMDAPQRFGPNAFWQLDWGQTEVRLDLGPVSTSFGTTNMWWGPGIRNAILMSNNAAGFPHATIESSRPLDIGIGRLEALWMFGRLQGTEWFDRSIDDNGRYLTGAAVAYSPDAKPLQGLSVGAARVFLANVPADGIAIGEYLLIFQSPRKKDFAAPGNPLGDDERDQLFSLFARWVLPASGFEVYGEWARNDHSWGTREYVLWLGHTAAYTVGLQKATPLSAGRVLVLSAEATQLTNPDIGIRDWPTPVYYSHGRVPRGYTNRGQVVGAALGPGGTAQFLGARLYAPWGGTSLHVQRELLDRDAWLQSRQAGQLTSDLEAQMNVGASFTWFRGGWDLQASADHTWRLNRYFVSKDDRQSTRFSLGARRRLGWLQP